MSAKLSGRAKGELNSSALVLNAVETWTMKDNQLHYTVVDGNGQVLAVESRTNTDSYKVFVEDPGADGIKADHKDNEAFDSIERGGKRTNFDDRWRKDQKLTDEQYAKMVADADVLYARLLQILLAQVKK